MRSPSPTLSPNDPSFETYLQWLTDALEADLDLIAQTELPLKNYIAQLQ